MKNESSPKPGNGASASAEVQNGDQDSDARDREAAALDELRKLLIGREQQQIVDLEKKIDEEKVDAERLSEVLPEAVKLSTNKDERLAGTLAPTITEAFQESVRRDPQGLVDAISPIMGPAIRRSIREAIRSMMQSLNQTLEHSVSAKSLKWRLEAYRTGKPFAEVVLLHTLVYQVDQVFLIDRRTGLLLCQVARDPEHAQDADLISAMLTAIRDFVRDSFGGDTEEAEQRQAPADNELRTIHVGNQTVWIEEGPRAALACVIQGVPRADLRERVIETLERIHVQHREALEEFDGDATPFATTSFELEELLEAQFESNSSGSNKKGIIAVAAVAAVLLCAVGWWGVKMFSERRAWNEYVQNLRDEPGLIVVETEVRDGKYHLFGLRDPAAKDPALLLGETTLSATAVSEDWRPHFSAEPKFVLLRAKQMLAPPPGVQLELSDDVLRVTGSAPGPWIADVRARTAAIPGVTQVETDKLEPADSDWAESLKELRARPGIMVVSAGWENGRYFVNGLLDPLADDPDGILEANGFDKNRIDTHWRLYDSHDAGLRLPRAKQRLGNPPTVDLQLRDDLLIATGEAPHAWLAKAGDRISGMYGIRGIDLSGVRDTDLQELRKSATLLKGLAIYMDVGKAEIRGDQQRKIAEIAMVMKSLLRRAKSADREITIQVVGHRAPGGEADLTEPLSRKRAESVLAAIVASGVPHYRLWAIGKGASEPVTAGTDPDSSAKNRRVEFQILGLD